MDDFPGNTLKNLRDSVNHGAITANDSVMYSQALLKTYDERVTQVTVDNPVLTNGKVMFNLKVYDTTGEVEVRRRFSEFEALRKAFVNRIAGLYVPKLPKKAIFEDSTSPELLRERSFHLEQFMRKVVRLPYLLQSPEFVVFTRPDENKKDDKGKVLDVVTQLE